MPADAFRPAPTRRLAQNPNLEQLRKQAKNLLIEYRSGNPQVVAEVQRFEHSLDPARFALHDAQRALARAYGFTSWSRLKAYVDGVNIARFLDVVKSGDLGQVRSMLASRPELVNLDAAADDEHRGLHYAVVHRDLAMVRLLLEAGADARKGVWPHRDATSAFATAKDRGYDEIIAVIEEEERLRREEMSCPNARVSPVQDRISTAISQGDAVIAISLLEADRSRIQACDRDGATPLHLAAEENNGELVAWLLERRANVRKQDRNGLTPLDRAALGADKRDGTAQHFPAIAKLPLDHRAEWTVRAAVALADLQRIQDFVHAEPTLLRQISRNGGLLTLAVKHGHLEVVQLLLDLGSDVDERITVDELEEPVTSWGMPLWHAARMNRLDIAKLLLDRRPDPNANVYASGWPLGNAWNHKDDPSNVCFWNVEPSFSPTWLLRCTISKKLNVY